MVNYKVGVFSFCCCWVFIYLVVTYGFQFLSVISRKFMLFHVVPNKEELKVILFNLSFFVVPLIRSMESRIMIPTKSSPLQWEDEWSHKQMNDPTNSFISCQSNMEWIFGLTDYISLFFLSTGWSVLLPSM